MIIRTTNPKLLLAACLLLLSLGCTSEPNRAVSAPPQPKSEPKSDLQTGRIALQKLFTTARMWAPDAQPIRLDSQARKTESPSVPPGKAPVWRASFASPSRSLQKPYMWSGLAGPDAPERGISPGSEDAFSAGNTSTRPFDLVYLKIDSDKAFEIAQEHGGSALTKKSPDLPVTYSLDWDPRKSQLVWHVIYGQNPNEPDLQVAVDASSGIYIRKET